MTSRIILTLTLALGAVLPMLAYDSEEPDLFAFGECTKASATAVSDLGALKSHVCDPSNANANCESLCIPVTWTNGNCEVDPEVEESSVRHCHEYVDLKYSKICAICRAETLNWPVTNPIYLCKDEGIGRWGTTVIIECNNP
jgi:hypothetical protein